MTIICSIEARKGRERVRRGCQHSRFFTANIERKRSGKDVLACTKEMI
jgi:hypothetical protein